MSKKRTEVLVTCSIIIVLLGVCLGLLYFLGGNLAGFAVFTPGPGEGQTTLTLQDADTDNLDDVYVGSGGDSNKNFGTSSILKTGSTARTYLNFNISAIPENQAIDNSQFCLYVLNTKKIQLININHVYSVWDESIITWNNQPCGINFDNSSACNLTAESSVQMDSVIQNDWLCWNVSNMVLKDYNAGKQNISFVLSTSDSDINAFNSKEAGDSSLIPYLNVTYHTANVAPTISLASPQDGATYGYNESIALDFIASDLDDNIDSCWYNLDDSSNVSLAGCSNTTFDVSGDGSYVLNIFVNDSLGLSASDSATFDVAVGAPTIELTSPIDSYSSSQDVTFIYTPTDGDLDSCELWGDFDSVFSLNQTDTTVTSGIENTFSLVLNEGSYLWNIVCNDSVGNSATTTNGNKTFYIDMTNPGLNLTEPVGEKTSRTTIGLVFNVTDSSPLSCLYNVYRGDSLEVFNSSANCSLGSSSFDVTVDADFALNFYVNDSAGNSNSSSLNFSVSTSSGGTTVVSGGGGGGGGGSSGEEIVVEGELSIGSVSSVILTSGESKKISLDVENTGLGFLSNCQVTGSGQYNSWVDESETKNLAAGEPYEFIFDVIADSDAEAGVYTVEVLVICDESSQSTSFSVEIMEKKLDFELVEAKRGQNGFIEVFYSLVDSSGVDQEVEVQFLLFDREENKVVEFSEFKSVSANTKEQYQTSIPVEEDVKGDLSLLVNLNSETYSGFVEESIFIGPRVTGLAIFSDLDNANKIIYSVVIIFCLIFIGFVIVRIFKLRKKAGKKHRKK